MLKVVPLQILTFYSPTPGAIALGPRLGRFKKGNEKYFRPSNYTSLVLGTFMLWWGWLGFNGGAQMVMSGGMTLCILSDRPLLYTFISWFFIFESPCYNALFYLRRPLEVGVSNPCVYFERFHGRSCIHHHIELGTGQETRWGAYSVYLNVT